MVERRERPALKPGRPRAFFAIKISSKSLMDGSVAGLFSRSWMNSLNPAGIVSKPDFYRKPNQLDVVPWVSRIMAAYSCCSYGKLLMNPSMSKAYSWPLFFCCFDGRPICLR